MGRRDLIFKARRKEKSTILKPKMKQVKKVDPLNKFNKRGLGPLKEFFRKKLFEREELYQEMVGGNPKYLFQLQNNGEYGLLAKFLQLLRRRELRAFFVLLATCSEHSREYVLDNWKKSNARASYFAFFPKHDGHSHPAPAEIWELYKPPNSQQSVENLCINSHFEFFTTQKEKEEYLKLYGIEGVLQPEPSFFLNEVQRKQFAYECGSFYEQLAGELAFKEKPENPYTFQEDLTDEEMNEAFDSAFF